MSTYKNPMMLKDEQGVGAKTKALTKIGEDTQDMLSDVAKNAATQDTLGNLAGDLNMEDAGAITEEVNVSNGVKETPSDNSGAAFYQSGGPIVDPNFYSQTT